MTTQRIAIIDYDGATETIREFRRYDLTEGRVKTLANGNPAARPVETTNPPFDPAIEVREGPVLNILADKVTEVFSVRAKTQAELDADAAAADEDVLRAAARDAAVVLVELVDALLAAGTIQAADFTPAVRQHYLDLKDVVDRVKSQ